MSRKLIWFWLGLGFLLFSALSLLEWGGQAGPFGISATWPLGSVYKITEADLGKTQPFDLTVYTTITVTADYQTQSWRVAADVTAVSGLTPVPKEALLVEDETGTFVPGGYEVTVGSGMGDGSFDVYYQLNLDEFGDASSSGPYDFEVTFTAYDNGNVLDTVTAFLTIGAAPAPYNEVVRVDLESSPSNQSITTADLQNRYFVIGDPAAEIEVFAITGYQVTISKITSGPAVPGLDLAALLEVGELGFTNDDDDSQDNPSSNLINDCSEISDQGLLCDDIPEDPGSLNLFSGGNTTGNAPGVRASMGLRLDLDALGDNAAGNAYTFTITFTVTED